VPLLGVPASTPPALPQKLLAVCCSGIDEKVLGAGHAVFAAGRALYFPRSH
jgi:hypothetical protein